MNFPAPIQKGRLVKRYKRFLVDIETANGEIITAHCANPGSMATLLADNAVVWYGAASNPNRKLKYDWYVVEVGGTPVGIHTNYANPIVREALDKKLIPELAMYDTIKPEVKYGENSRVDFLLTQSQLPDCYLEIKSITFSRENGLAEFPDSPSVRAAKHMGELANMTAQGHRAVILYLVQRADCELFTIAADIDPKYAVAATHAKTGGVEALCYACNLSEGGIDIAKPVNIIEQD